MDTQATLETVEKTLDVLEDQIDTIEEAGAAAVTVVKNNPAILAGVAAVSLVVGGLVGYKYAQEKLIKKFDLVLEEQIEATKKYYGAIHKEGEYSNPVQLAEALEEKVVDLGYTPDPKINRYHPGVVEKPAESEEELMKTPAQKEAEARAAEIRDAIENNSAAAMVQGSEVAGVKNVFTDAVSVNGEWDEEAETRKRQPGRPYVIKHDDYMANEPEYTQIEYTFYEGDGTLVDERDQPFNDTEATVGDDNLVLFGHGSKDPNVVYIRNERLEMDFEVVRHPGKYTQVVLDIPDDTLAHSDRHGLRRFRSERE